MAEFTVIVAGGGASGVLVATRLVRKSAQARVVIVEPRERLGRGMAYSTPHHRHLLNVPAGRMSAFAEDPEHFVRFLRERFGERYTASSFVPRPLYGDYLEFVTQESRAFAGERLRCEQATILAANVDAAGVRAICDNGPSLHDLFGAVRAVASRPRAWRATLDSLRPRTNHLWQALSVSDQRRFVRHVMPYWNVHRHRMAPQVAREIADETSSGRLRMLAGRTGAFTQMDRGLHVPIRVRGENRELELEVGRAINCSGPAHDFRQLENPLIGNLLAQGIMQPLATGIGVDIAPSGALRDRHGADSPAVFAIGPVRYGTLIETTAMPEIRAQAEELATLLVTRHSSTTAGTLQ